MPFFQRFSIPLKLTLLLYLLALLGVGGYLFWPEPRPAPLHVTSVRLAPEGDRIVVEGSGFDSKTLVSISREISGRHNLRYTLPTWGRGGEMVQVGNFAYAANQKQGLLIFNLTEPERPRVAGTLELPGLARTLVVAQGLAYVACHKEGLALVDVNKPETPVLLARLPEVKLVQGLAVQGDKLYAVVLGSGVKPALVVIDISTPRQPRVIERVPLPGQPLGVRLWGDHLLVAAGRSGLLSLPLQNGLPGKWSRLELPGSAHDLVVVENFAYVACGLGGLAVVDLADNKLRLSAHIPVFGTPIRITHEDGRLYLSSVNDGGYVFDLARPDQPTSLGGFDVDGEIMGLVVKEGHAYLNTVTRGVQVLDLRSQAPLQGVFRDLKGEQSHALVFGEDLLLVGTGGGKLHVFRLPEEGGALRLATIPLSGPCRALWVKQGYAYANIDNSGIEVIDVRNPLLPVTVSFYPYKQERRETGDDYSALSIALAEGRGVVTNGRGLLQFFDLVEGKLAGFQPGSKLPGAPGKVAWGRGRIYISLVKGGGIVAVNLLPGRVTEVSDVFPLPVPQVMDMAVLGTTVVLACGFEGLYVIDFANPAAPRLIAALPLEIFAGKIVLDGFIAHVGDQRGRIIQVDLSHPSHPRPGALFQNTMNMKDFTVAKGQVFIAAGSSGLFSLPLPKSMKTLHATKKELNLALPSIESPGHYTLHFTDGSQSLTLPGILQLGPR